MRTKAPRKPPRKTNMRTEVPKKTEENDMSTEAPKKNRNKLYVNRGSEKKPEQTMRTDLDAPKNNRKKTI